MNLRASSSTHFALVMILFLKSLTKTDIQKRLSVPTEKKTCFLNFRGRHKVKFKVIDENGKVWIFVCSTRKQGDYPKPVLTKGWLQFARWWKLVVGDEVILYRIQDKDDKAKGHYGIEVIKRASPRSWVPSPPVQNHDPDRTMGVASYVEEEPTLTSHSTDQTITYDQTEGLHNFEFISLRPHSQLSEPKFFDFFQLGSQTEEKRSNQAF
ncbi:hypothetical protein CRYUN_Cryun10bG0162900 [Craigia yunnanensis]